MHIPDGVIESPAVLAGTWILGGGGLLLASRRFSGEIGEDRAALVGVLGAFVFAAQMANFPVLLGVSAHLVGSALLTLLLGPAASIVILGAVLLVQCLLMQDGGLIALGANILNLAVVPAIATASLLRVTPARIRRAGGYAVPAGMIAVLASTVACGIELVLGAGLSLETVVAGLLVAQSWVAVTEGVITALALAGIRAILGARTPTWPATGGAP